MALAPGNARLAASRQDSAPSKASAPRAASAPSQASGPLVIGPEHNRALRYEPRLLADCEKQCTGWPLKQPLQSNTYREHMVSCRVGQAVWSVARDVERRQGPLEDLVKVLSSPKRSVQALKAIPKGCLVLVPETSKVVHKDPDKAKGNEDWVRVHMTNGMLQSLNGHADKVICLDSHFNEKDFVGKRFPSLLLCGPH